MIAKCFNYSSFCVLKCILRLFYIFLISVSQMSSMNCNGKQFREGTKCFKISPTPPSLCPCFTFQIAPQSFHLIRTQCTSCTHVSLSHEFKYGGCCAGGVASGGCMKLPRNEMTFRGK